jgi:hypothetical protein
MPDLAYIATIAPVREVILAGTADLAYWQKRLAPLGLFPHDDGGRAAVTISAIAGRFRGLPFREVSVAVVAGEQDDGRADAIYLIGAFNSSRPLAWSERTFFRTPYQLAGIRLSQSPAVGAAVTVAGQVVYRAEKRAAPAEPLRREAQEWQGRIYLPPNGARRELFYARLAGPTEVYPFDAADTLTIQPRGDGVWQWLVESGFGGQEWRVRAAAVHARSRTIRR